MLEFCERPITDILELLRGDLEDELEWLSALITSLPLPTETRWESDTLTAETIRTLIRTKRQLDRSGTAITDVDALTCAVAAKILLWQTLGDLTEVLLVDRGRLDVLERNAQRQLQDLDRAFESLNPIGGVA